MAETKSLLHGVEVSDNTRKSVTDLEAAGRKVQVVGRVVNGKLEINQGSLEEMAKKFPNAEMSFIAVNAPFDPASPSAEDLR